MEEIVRRLCKSPCTIDTAANYPTIHQTAGVAVLDGQRSTGLDSMTVYTALFARAARGSGWGVASASDEYPSLVAR